MADLTPTFSGILAEHSELIEGLETIYRLLIELAYVQNTDVQVPPHGLPKDPIAVAPLRSAGLSPETIEVIGRLPWFTNEIIERQRGSAGPRDGIPIAPFSAAASYLLGSGRHDEAREIDVSGQSSDERIPPTAFKLATTNSSAGYNLAYDLADKSILQWHPAGWAECQRFPVAEFMAEWIRKVRALEWLPWVDDNGWEIEELENSDSAISKDFQNRYSAKRRLYEECGWPNAFDSDEFQRRREE